MARRDGSRLLCLLAAASAGCSHAHGSSEPPAPSVPCQRWEVTVTNELSFPLAVYLYAKGGRAMLGAAPPGITILWASDTGQVTFNAPLGQSTIARGRQVSSSLKCVSRLPTET